MRAMVLGLVGLVMLAACAPKAETPAPSPAPAASATPSPVAATPVAFSVSVTLSAKAIAKLVKGGDKVIVSASYYGTPRPDLPLNPADSPGVALGAEEQRVGPVNQVVKFSGAYDFSKAAEKTVGEPHVLINVTSSDAELGQYPMECNLFQGTLKEAAALGDAGAAITCRAFGEG